MLAGKAGDLNAMLENCLSQLLVVLFEIGTSLYIRPYYTKLGYLFYSGILWHVNANFIK